ncbi:ABC transporter ATP-binding protein [Sedimentibacter sp. MB31-C6]|uniref:ABC transporter ATP-binding protein n=1 Tax=Sedimentibacter sp. MB31-C6 TaxID=3109366 RepID=UPI002DDCF01F|nr:ABC transporter ATP-binding protein [Sedimentibacter sp. MB36-C1]WSI05264.1 ABC transporter ATP-binding protein [Sedimentibacter sp. MB36-C1]
MKNKNKSNAGIILSYSRGLKRFLFISAIATILRVLTSFATPQVIRFTVDSVIGEIPMNYAVPIMNIIEAVGGREGLRLNLWLCTVVVILLALSTSICDYIGRTFIAKGSEGIIKNIRNSLYEHIQKLPYSWHIKNQTGDIIQRATSDVEILRNFLSTQLSEMFRTVMLILVSLLLMFSMNFKLTLVVLIFIPIIIIYSSIFYGILSKKFLVADEAEGELFTSAQENLTGVRVVRAFGRESYEIEKFSEKNNKFSDLWVKLGYQLGYYWGLGDFVTGLQIMTVISLGVIQAVNGVITLGEFLVFVTYNQMLAWPVRSFGRILGELSKTRVSVGRICEILKEPAEEDEADNITPDLNGDIEFNNVTYYYEGNNPVVNDVSFKIKANTTFAILGGTGSGKTTLMHLLNRLYDLTENNGSITIGGIDIRDIKRDYLRKNIGMVLQEPFLFSRTIKENIKIVKPNATDEEIEEASSTAQVHKSIENFSKGYDTIVGERGVTLSGGQKQRVAMARMLLQNTPIMVFDDSLSAVDAETDANIRIALKKRKNKSTVILISHRITTLMEADIILVLDKGKVSDIGTHEELIKRDGIYKNIYNVQMNIYDDND